jgi:two-component system, OmpR family, sensor histidine kinase RstB
MTRLFIRIYLGAVVAVLVAVGATILIIAGGFYESIESHIRSIAIIPTTHIRTEISAITDNQTRQSRLSALAKGYGYPVEIVTEAALDFDTRERALLLQKRELLIRFEGRSPLAYMALTSGQEILKIGPLPTIRPMAEKRGWIALVMLCLLMAGSMFVLVRPLEIRLRRLGKAAEVFGRGELEHRIEDSNTDVVATLGSSFNQMAGRINQLVNGQQELFNAVAHELRTPLARLRFAIEEIALEENKQAREVQLEAANTDIEELSELIDELLTFARLQHGAPPLAQESIRMKELLDDVKESVKILRPEIRLDFVELDFVDDVYCGDPRYLRRALLNLVSNAMRYANGQVNVYCEKNHGGFVVQIDDDGPGIPEKNRQQVFEPFARLEANRSKDRGGHGLGLAITRRVAQWHRGSVEVVDAPLGGARFILRLG